MGGPRGETRSVEEVGVSPGHHGVAARRLLGGTLRGPVFRGTPLSSPLPSDFVSQEAQPGGASAAWLANSPIALPCSQRALVT